MSPANKTRAFLAAVIALCAAWEGYGLSSGSVSLISPVITDVWTAYPLTLAVSFLLAGHWLSGRGTTGKEEGKG